MLDQFIVNQPDIVSVPIGKGVIGIRNQVIFTYLGSCVAMLPICLSPDDPQRCTGGLFHVDTLGTARFSNPYQVIEIARFNYPEEYLRWGIVGGSTSAPRTYEKTREALLHACPTAPILEMDVGGQKPYRRLWLNFLLNSLLVKTTSLQDNPESVSQLAWETRLYELPSGERKFPNKNLIG